MVLLSSSFSLRWPVLAFCLYFYEASKCTTLEYLTNTVALSEISRYAATVMEARVVCTLSVRCWHTERRTTRRNGKTHTTTRTVTTYTHSENFEYGLCENLSTFDEASFARTIQRIAGTNTYIGLDSSVNWTFASEADKATVENRRAYLYQLNQHRDTNCSATVHYETPGLKPRMALLLPDDEFAASIAGAEEDKPFMFTNTAFWIFTLLMLTYPYRKYIESKVGGINLKFCKKLHSPTTYAVPMAAAMAPNAQLLQQPQMDPLVVQAMINGMTPQQHALMATQPAAVMMQLGVTNPVHVIEVMTFYTAVHGNAAAPPPSFPNASAPDLSIGSAPAGPPAYSVHNPLTTAPAMSSAPPAYSGWTCKCGTVQTDHNARFCMNCGAPKSTS